MLQRSRDSSTVKRETRRRILSSQQLSLENFNLPVRLKQYIMETVTWVMELSFNELLNAIYYLFREYQENSIFNYS